MTEQIVFDSEALPAQLANARRMEDNDFVSTPSARIFSSPDFGRAEPELADYLPERPSNPMTLERTSQQVAEGVSLRAAAADFLDDFRFARDDEDRAQRIAAAPALINVRTDAYLAALAEHVAATFGLSPPPWCREPGRFLDHLWWPSGFPALEARAIVESPAAFRRRGIFIGRDSLRRV